MMKRLLPYAPAALILLSLLSVILLLNLNHGRNSYVMFFPLDSRSGKNAEIRMVHRRRGEDLRIKRFVSELILGPVELELNPFIPVGTKMKSMVRSGQTLYLDFNRFFIDESARIPLSYDEKMGFLRENILFNFPAIKEIVVTVEGQVPGSEFFFLSEEENS
jgi:hypothetical protein